MRTLAPRLVAVLVVLAALASSAVLAPPAAPDDSGPLDEIGQFRPFPAPNQVTGGVSDLDARRRNWFFTSMGSPEGGDTLERVWLFDPDTLRQVGAPLVLPGRPSGQVVTALDEQSGLLLVPHVVANTWQVAAVGASASGPSLVATWVAGTALASEDPGTPDAMRVQGAQVDQGRLYLVASVDFGSPETALVRVDIGRLVAGSNPLDWRYRVRLCPNVPTNGASAAVGKSRFGPRIFLACKSQNFAAPQANNQLQGVVAVEMGSETAAPAAFQQTFYPVSGSFSMGTSLFDPSTDRVMLRRTGPPQLIAFDGQHRRWMRPTVFGQNNLKQVAQDPEGGRLYGLSDDPGAGETRLFLLAAEPRTTPPGNGVVQLFHGAPFGAVTGARGMLFDPVTNRLVVADTDYKNVRNGSAEADGLYFRIFKETRPAPPPAPAPPDPDKTIVNLSGEAQGYGARISYVGGVGGGYSNATKLTYDADTNAVAPGQPAGGTRHVTFARTLRLRLTEGEAAAEAIASQPEGMTDAELQANGQPWPDVSARCGDFGDTPGEVTVKGAKANCQQAKRYATSEATYEADGSDPYTNPVQRASTSSSTAIDAKRGVVTTVTSEGSLDIPGVVRIGKVTAITQTWAAGADGTAGFAYKRTMQDVSIAGQQSCTSSCDPEQVARDINERFASATDKGVLIRAEVPQADPTLLGSKGGVQAIFQRDFWDHEQDVALNDGADDRYEMPAFVITIYQDREYPNHEVYSLAGVQAVSRLPRALRDRLPELQSAPEAFQYTQLPAALKGPGVISSGLPAVFAPGTEGTPAAFVPGAPGQPAAAGGGGQLRRLIRNLRWGLAFPFSSPGVLAMWTFLGVPVFLASRRRLLLSRQAQRGVSP